MSVDTRSAETVENATAEVGPVRATPKPGPKDPYFSNAKLILIALVVAGHSWSPMLEHQEVRAFYLTLYAMHMPAFILISGYLSRSFTGRPDQMRRLLTGVALPYVIFCIGYGLLRVYTEGEFQANPLYPWYLLWFLPALFVWRLTSPIWRAVRWPITVAFLIAFTASLTELPSVFDLGRILQFLPFFVIGTQLRREHFELVRRRWIRWTGLAASLGVLAAAYVINTSMVTEWVYYSKGYGQLETPLWAILPLRLGTLTAAAILLVTFFAWVPARQLRLTALGERTIYAYLLHGFIVKIADDGLDLYKYDVVNTVYGAVGVTALAFGLALLLMTVPVRWLFSWAVEPRLPWLFTAHSHRKPQPTA